MKEDTIKDPTKKEIDLVIKNIDKSIDKIEKDNETINVNVSEKEASKNLNYLDRVLNEIEEDSNDRKID